MLDSDDGRAARQGEHDYCTASRLGGVGVTAHTESSTYLEFELILQ